MEEVPRRTSLVPLASPCFVLRLIGVETEALRLPGAGGGSFLLYGGTFARSSSVSLQNEDSHLPPSQPRASLNPAESDSLCEKATRYYPLLGEQQDTPEGAPQALKIELRVLGSLNQSALKGIFADPR